LYEWGIFKLRFDYVQRLLYIHWRMSRNNSEFTSIIVLIMLATMWRNMHSPRVGVPITLPASFIESMSAAASLKRQAWAEP
jgi:uncharacterized membrane protein YhhN